MRRRNLPKEGREIYRKVFGERRFTPRKESDAPSQVPEYIDRRTGQPNSLVMRDLVFVNFRTGEPNKNSSYDTHLYKLCDEAGIKRVCMHALRHEGDRARGAAKGIAAASGPCQYQDCDGSIRSCDRRFIGKGCKAVLGKGRLNWCGIKPENPGNP